MLTPESIAAANPGPLGRDVTVIPSTASTNSDLLADARRGAPQGRVLVAEAQTGGRGRLGRSWHSPPGENLYVSILLRLEGATVAQLPPLALVAGLAVKEALDEAVGLAARVKWPNDVLIDGRKVAGILAEATDRTPPALVLGIGLNVNQIQFPDELADVATSLAVEAGRRFGRAEILAAVLRAVDRRINQAGSDLPTVLEAWTDCSSTVGTTVFCPDGIEGKALGVDAGGALLVRDAAGRIHPIIAGPIQELRSLPSPPDGPDQ